MADGMLTQDQKDALQEIANIGMGRAGASIAPRGEAMRTRSPS